MRVFWSHCVYRSTITSDVYVCIDLAVVRCTSRRVDALMLRLNDGVLSNQAELWTGWDRLGKFYAATDEYVDLEALKQASWKFWDQERKLYREDRYHRIDMVNPGDLTIEKSKEEDVKSAMDKWIVCLGKRKARYDVSIDVFFALQ